MPGKWGPNRGRRECYHEVRTKLRTHKVEIRFDRNEGEFFADLNGEEFKDSSIKELERLLLEEAEKADNVQWERWIIYSLEGHGYANYRKYQDVDISTVGIEFECVDLSIPQDGIARREREREVDDDGSVKPLKDETYLGQIYSRVKHKIIRFTPERWVALTKIAAVIIDARKKLGALLDQDEQDDVEVRLDSMNGPLLMAGGDDE